MEGPEQQAAAMSAAPGGHAAQPPRAAAAAASAAAGTAAAAAAAGQIAQQWPGPAGGQAQSREDAGSSGSGGSSGAGGLPSRLEALLQADAAAAAYRPAAVATSVLRGQGLDRVLRAVEAKVRRLLGRWLGGLRRRVRRWPA